VDIKGFWPITLVGGIYKFISKVLANRLKTVLEKVFSKSYNAFIRRRPILDSILLTKECIDSRIRSEDHGVLCKLDLEKV